MPGSGNTSRQPICRPPKPQRREDNRPTPRFSSSATILHGANPDQGTSQDATGKPMLKPRILCSYCKSPDHYLTHCKDLKDLSSEEIVKWIREEKRCWRCATQHMAMDCTLGKPCPKCNGKLAMK